MKYIIFGGSFDPIHKAHLSIANSAIKKIDANYLYIVPAKRTKYKNFDASNDERVKMINLAIMNEPMIGLSLFEINNQAEISYTIETVKYFHQNFPDDEAHLLIGQDQLEQFHLWKDYEEILKYVTLIVAPRNKKINWALVNKYHAIVLEPNLHPESSSLFKETFNLQYLNKDVANYIVNNGIYYQYLLPKYMTNNRYLHSMRVAKMMKNLFKDHGSQKQNNAWIAGLYHDICKCFSKQELELIAYEMIGMEPTNYKLLHGPIGTYYLNKVYGLQNQDVLNAICRHTKPFDYGIGELTKLDMALFCCDKLEPMRTNDDVANIEYFRELLKENIEKCFYELYGAITKQYS